MVIKNYGRKWDLLATPVFVASIALLVLNDHVLKAVFHNWLTGKLSDFAGLCAFTLFACAIWPHRTRSVGTAVCIAFAFWKSSYSQPAIDLLNDFLAIQIYRTVDYTDLLVLPIVWIACYHSQDMKAWPARRWLVQLFAMFSLVAFTATTILHTHGFRDSARILRSDQPIASSMEKDIQALFDEVAKKYGLQCKVCDSLSSGRLYSNADEEWPHSFSLVANFDAARSLITFEVRSSALNQKPQNVADVDSLRLYLTQQLQSRFPGIAITTAERPKEKHIAIGVWKKRSLSSYLDSENQDDYNRALRIADEIVSKHGLTKGSASFYYIGRLFGTSPYDRDLSVSVGIADSPLVIINILCYSDDYRELQKVIASEVEHRLQKEFGKERASLR